MTPNLSNLLVFLTTYFPEGCKGKDCKRCDLIEYPHLCAEMDRIGDAQKMIKGNPGANRDITRGAFTNGSIGGEQHKPFVFHQCFGKAWHTHTCQTCGEKTACAEA
jgi:hypothetical protein